MNMIRNYKNTLFLIAFIFSILIIASCSRGLREGFISEVVNSMSYKLSPSQAPELKWKMKLRSLPRAFSIINNQNVLITSNRGELYIIDIVNGKRSTRIWKPFHKPIDVLFLESEEGTIYFTSVVDKGLYAYNLEEAKIRWKFNLSDLQGEMVIIGDTAFISQEKKYILAFNKNTGERIKKVRINTSIAQGIYKYENLLWIITDDGCLLSYDVNLKPKDFFNLKLNPNPVITRVGSKFIAGDSNGRLVLVDVEQKKILFEKLLSAPIYSNPLISDNVIVVGLANGLVEALNFSNNSEIWNYQGEGLVNLPLIGTESMVIVPFTRGQLVALDLTSGNKLWHYEFDQSIRLARLVPGGILIADRKNRIHYLESKR